MSAIFISHSSKDNVEAEALAAWLQAQGHTSFFIDYSEQHGIKAGTDWEQVLYHRLRQCQAVIALLTQNWVESKWCFAEMIQAREKGKAIFPVIVGPCQFPEFLADTQKIDLIADRESGYRRLAHGLKEHGLDPTDMFDPDPTRAPYPGLSSFEEADAAVFFGRGREILELRETMEALRRNTLDAQPLVLVLGASGSGKSSLVRAGLIPRLKKDKDNWLALRPFRPQDQGNAVDGLAFAFVDTYEILGKPCDEDLLRARLTTAMASSAAMSGELLLMSRELASAAGHRDATVLITMDQAEELFDSGSFKRADPFLQFLGASLSTGDRHLMALATLRSDFLGTFQEQIALPAQTTRAALKHLPITVEPIPVERYGELVQGPADRAEISLESNLVQRLLQDGGQPDSLPLLAFTLRRLWELHFERPHPDRSVTLTIHSYEELGGIAGAVQNAADRILNDSRAF